ncbi:unnamed protein product [Discosporangium mesarthrocarpum]
MAEKRPRDFDTLIHPLELTGGGRPKLLPDEIEIVTKEEASLFACRGSRLEERLRDGTATLTTHRVLWFERDGPTRVSVCINIWDLREVRPNQGGRFKSSSKIHLCSPNLLPAPSLKSAVMLSVKGRDDFFESLQSALRRKAWVKATAAEVMERRASLAGSGGATSGAGIAGILRRQEANRQATAQIASEAFSDLKSLIQKAKEVVAVVERYSATIREKQAAAEALEGGTGGGGGDATP